ncbi:sporulation 11-2 isoform X2 [Wolffia australiana]
MSIVEEEIDTLRSSIFYCDQRLCSADILPSSEVRTRIEVSVLTFLSFLSAASPVVPYLSLVKRQRCNAGLRQGLLSDVSSLFLSTSFCRRSLMRAKETKAFVRVWKVMELCLQILEKGKCVTQRELFYRLLSDSPDFFASQSQVNKTIQEIVALLHCTRHSLGIMASSRGAIAGRLKFLDTESGVVDCSALGPTGYAITGDLSILQNLDFISDARYIIILEKDAIFQRLVEDQIFNQIPCILITAKGYPDIATRFLLHRLSRAFPKLPIMALVDWNPAGLEILCTYKFGSSTMGLEAYRYACDVKWLGLRSGDLRSEMEEREMTARELKMAERLMASGMLQEAELVAMVARGKRVEVEALYYWGFSFLGKFLVEKIVQGDYI